MAKEPHSQPAYKPACTYGTIEQPIPDTAILTLSAVGGTEAGDIAQKVKVFVTHTSLVT